MSLSQALQHLLKANLVALRDPPSNPNISSPKYNSNAKYSPGHDTDYCWALKCNIQDLIDNKTIEFDPPPTPNVITAPMPSHGKGVNAIDDVSFVSTINDLTAPLMTVKNNLLRASLFSGFLENCYHCTSQTNGCM